MSDRDLKRREAEARIASLDADAARSRAEAARADRDRPAAAWRNPQSWVLLFAAIAGFGTAAFQWSRSEISSQRAGVQKERAELDRDKAAAEADSLRAQCASLSEQLTATTNQIVEASKAAAAARKPNPTAEERTSIWKSLHADGVVTLGSETIPCRYVYNEDAGEAREEPLWPFRDKQSGLAEPVLTPPKSGG
jgi:hypothetical protein